MYALPGHPENNWFSRQQKNWIPDATGGAKLAASLTFEYGSKDATHITVAHMAAATESGEMVSQPKYPAQIYFVPPAALTQSIDSKLEFREQLGSVPSGTTIFEVWSAGDSFCVGSDGQPAEDVMTCPGRVRMGEVVTTSKFEASKWGDESIYMQHGRWATKERRQCQYASLPDVKRTRLFKMGGSTDTLCISGTECPTLDKTLGLFGGTQVKKTSACPFDEVLKNAIPALPKATDYYHSLIERDPKF